MSGERYEQVGWEVLNDWFSMEEASEMSWPPETPRRPLYVKVPAPEPTDEQRLDGAIGWTGWVGSPGSSNPDYEVAPVPDRCPTCGSEDPTVEVMPAHIESEAQVLCFLCGEGRCSDPWHTKEPS